MQEKILMFRTITDDSDIAQKQVIKFINWGKGDVQQALNYYFINLEKGKITKKAKIQAPRSQSQKDSIISRPSQIDNTKQEKTREKYEEHPEKRISEMSVRSQQSQGNSKDAFEVLRKGSIQHKKTHDFIKHVRQTYKLPIKGRPQQQLIKSSKSCLPEHEGKIPEEFLMVDCLTRAHDPQHIEKLMNKKNSQEDGKAIQNSNNETNIQRPERLKSRLNIIQLSVSQSCQEEDSFKDIDEYQYKHVYSQPARKQKQITRIEEENQQHRQIPPKNPKQPTQPINLPNPKKPKQPIPQKQPPKQQPLLLKKPDKKQSKPEQQKQTLNKEQLYLGQYFVNGFCTEMGRYQSTCIGEKVEIVGFVEEVKGKGKKNFGRNTQRTMNMRISWRGREIGRIKNDQVRIIMPLIDQKLIRMQFCIKDIPILADFFKPITLTAKVFILPKLITEPVVQNFQPQQNGKDQVDQISALFQKLSIPITTPPLIKAKSKYITAQKKPKKKYESIDGQHLQQLKKQEQIRNQLEEKNRNQLSRIRSDPNYKSKQQSLKDMITKNQENLQKAREIVGEEREEEGHVRKKVIEIDKQEDKDKLSELIELHQQNCQPYFPKSNFKSQLYPYQAMALAWMLKRQGFLNVEENKEQLHPLWTEYEINTSEKYRHLYFNELTGQLCVKKPTAVIKCRGGILADQMGLGKTVMMTALIVSNPPLQQKGTAGQGCTLVIVPLTLLSQWQSQISRHTQHQKVITYYSSDRKKLLNSLNNYDVVLSTYGTISHEYAQGYHTKKQGIYKYKWHRVILDEAHYIKGRIIQTSKAVYQLQSLYRWCLTGTPIQNSATDMFSLLHFIKYTPWSQFACWNRFVVKPLEDGDQSIYNILRTILKQVFLRRTKSSKTADGKPIIQLPPRISKVELLTMNEKEREFYDSIYQASRSDFDALIEKGILQAKYMQVLQILMRLRQICCHPILFKSITKYTKNAEQFQIELKKLIQKSQKKPTARTQSQSEDQYYEPIIDADNQQIQVKTNNSYISEQYFKEVLQKIASQNLENCIICLEQPQDPVVTCCLHIFCKACNIRQIQEKGSCGFCRRALGRDDFIYLPRQNRLNIKKGRDKEQVFLSTKMIALNQHILQLKPDDKVVIFSQFLGMLDLLEQQLKKNRLRYVRMQGSNTHKQRTKIVKSFQQDPKVQIFLVSLKTAGVGLNLVAANKVFLMDPWWNPAVEEQAIQRVHRIGQKRQVEIVRFIIDRTIQTRMLELNTQKKILSQNILNQNQDKDSNAKQKIEKLKYLMENY